MEFYMKKFLTSALAIALSSISIVSFAQDHSLHDSHGQWAGMDSTEMQAMKQDMQKKMNGAKTTEEHQQMMQKKMGSMHGQMPMGVMSH
jgi:hypothetical protein